MPSDQERFEKHWEQVSLYVNMTPKDWSRNAFRAALAIGREEGRKERTIELHREIDKRYYAVGDFVERRYPECFEKGDE